MNSFKLIRLISIFVCVCFLLRDDSIVIAKNTDRINNSLKSYRKQYEKIYAPFRDSMKTIEQFCQKKGLSSEADLVKTLSSQIDFHSMTIQKLSPYVRPEISRNLSADQRFWRMHLYKSQNNYAQAMFSLSKNALNSGLASMSYRLLREVVRQNPDHPSARRMLGFVRFENRWVTPLVKSQKRKGMVWHEKFGWLKKDFVERYEQGERYYIPIRGGKGGWIPAAQEATIRQNFANAWEIETDHFIVKTNQSLERGVEIASQLEDYYEFFFSTFAGFFNGRSQSRKLIKKGHKVVPESRKHRVYYYRTRDQYNRELKKHIPNIGITNGLYLTNTRTCYFFHAEKVDNDSTLYHEATHQLFYETMVNPPRRGQRIPMVALNGNFWIIEGIACYMESFHNRNGLMSVGDPTNPRFQAAHIRLTRDNYYVPLANMASMGMNTFQSQNRKIIAMNYSQASGLSKFFMEYEGGKYRDSLIEHLSQIYRQAGNRRFKVPSLAKLTGASFLQLDSQYRSFISQIGQPGRAYIDE